jgi:hypothetical protein
MKHPPLFKRGFPQVARHPKLIRQVILWMRTIGNEVNEGHAL